MFEIPLIFSRREEKGAATLFIFCVIFSLFYLPGGTWALRVPIFIQNQLIIFKKNDVIYEISSDLYFFDGN